MKFFLKKVVLRYGSMKILIPDPGPQLTSALPQEFLQASNIKHHTKRCLLPAARWFSRAYEPRLPKNNGKFRFWETRQFGRIRITNFVCHEFGCPYGYGLCAVFLMHSLEAVLQIDSLLPNVPLPQTAPTPKLLLIFVKNWIKPHKSSKRLTWPILIAAVAHDENTKKHVFQKYDQVYVRV